MYAVLYHPSYPPLQNYRLFNLYEAVVKEVANLEHKLEIVLQSWQPAQLKSVGSIKGIGKRATAMLIVFTQGFKNTHSHRQLISFAGLAPTEYSSGSSIQGKPRICKRGGKPLRDVLYMCAMSAIKHNQVCKELFDRLKAKGKNGKVALIAMGNKLLKQAFAVAKSGGLYQPNYSSVRP